MDFEKHIRRLGWIYLVCGGILLLVVVWLAKYTYDLMKYSPDVPDDPLGRFIVCVFLAILTIVLSLALIPVIGATVTLLRNLRIGRGWAIVAAIFMFLFFPVGTIAAVYAFSFLTRSDVKNYYLSLR